MTIGAGVDSGVNGGNDESPLKSEEGLLLPGSGFCREGFQRDSLEAQ